MVLRRPLRTLVVAFAALTSVAASGGLTAAAAQTSNPSSLLGTPLSGADKERLNANTIGVVGGKSDSASLRAVEDLAAVLDDGFNLRVLAVLGKGELNNVQDILYLKNTDMGVTQANVLAYLKRTGQLGSDIEQRLRYITKLFNEEVHIIANTGVNDLRELAGKKVNFGEVGSGTQLTAVLIFDALGIKVTPVNMVQSDALVAIGNGQIAATVLVAGKPSPLLDIFRIKGQLKLLPIPYEQALETDYLPAQLTNADYPTLIAEGDSVDTIAVPAVLAVFNWRPGTDRHRRVSTFVNAFFSKFDAFRGEARHPKWREVNLTAKLPGWERFSAAEDWLRENAPKAAQVAARPAGGVGGDAAQRGTFLEFLAAQRGAGGLAVAAGQEEQLFERFQQWMQSRNGAAPGAAGTAARTPAAAPNAPSSTAPIKGRLW